VSDIGKVVLLVWETHKHEAFVECIILPGQEEDFLKHRVKALAKEGAKATYKMYKTSGNVSYRNKHMAFKIEYHFEEKRIGSFDPGV
jgi:hypothetical protein